MAVAPRAATPRSMKWKSGTLRIISTTRSPGAHAEPLEVRRRAGDVLGVLRVGPLGEGAVGLLGAETDLVGVGRHRVEEAADDRLALGRLVELGLGDLAHGYPLTPVSGEAPFKPSPAR